MPGTMLVRLKPYNRKAGYVIRRLCIGGVRFIGERGWYEVPAALAEQLRGIRQTHREGAALAFDVCSHEEAEQLEVAEEKRKAAEVAKANEPHKIRASEVRAGTLTTDDLPSAGDDEDEASDKPKRRRSKRS